MRNIKKSSKPFISLLSVLFMVFLLSENVLAQNRSNGDRNGQVQRRGDGPLVDSNRGRRGGRGRQIQGDRLPIEMNDFVYRGQNSFNIKDLIRERYGRIRLRNTRLKRLRLIIKSRRGHGSAQLYLGGHLVQEQNIPGVSNISQWNSSNYYTYHILDFDLRGPTPFGPWILQVNGRVRIKRFVAIIGGNRGSHHPPRATPPQNPQNRYNFSLGEFKISKIFFGDTLHRISVDKSFVEQINVFCKSKRFDVFSFKVFFRNGTWISLPELAGSYRKGQSRSGYLPAPYNRSHLHYIELEAISPYLEGSRGVMKIDMEALR